MKDTDLSYLNGFLDAMALVNVGTNHGCWYQIEPVRRVGSLDQSLQSHFTELFAWLSSRYGTKDHKLEVEALPDWKAAVRQVAHLWFFEMEFSPKLTEDDQPRYVTEALLKKLEQALVGGVSAWSVRRPSPHIEWSDLLLEDRDGYYLLHFSWSD
jgi:hypothetical protein